MNTALRILVKLQEANKLLAEAQSMAENLTEIVPYPTANELQIELSSLKESAYIIDRDLTAYCEGVPGTDEFMMGILGEQG